MGHGQIRVWYEPNLEELYEVTPARKADLEELEAISGTFASRERHGACRGGHNRPRKPLYA